MKARSQLSLNYGSSPELSAYLAGKNPGDSCELKLVWQLTENDTANSTAEGPITEIELPDDTMGEGEGEGPILTITLGAAPANAIP